MTFSSLLATNFEHIAAVVISRKTLIEIKTGEIGSRRRKPSCNPRPYIEQRKERLTNTLIPGTEPKINDDRQVKKTTQII